VRFFRRLAVLLRECVSPGSLDDDVAEELRFHLERQIQENMRAGMAAGDARRAAHLTIGNLQSFREESRSARAGALIHQAGRDVAFGIRLLRRSPGLAITSALVVALGIGTTTAIFSLVYGVILRPPPYADPDRLVAVWSRVPKSPQRVRVNPADHREWRTSATVFEDIALANAPQNFNLIGSGEPERIVAARLSSNLLSVLGVRPALGRSFTEEETRIDNDRVALLSDGLWRRRFGGDPSIVGRTIDLSGIQYEVVGVMPPDFHFPERDYQLWIPLTINPRLLTREIAAYDHFAVARLRPGVRLDEAQREISAIAHRLEAAYPATNRGVRVEVLPLLEESIRFVRPALYAMLAAVSCLLLVACLNLAGLLGARAVARTREFTVRLALGASRGRLMLQTLAEVSPILALGGIAGIAGARAAVAAFIPIAPTALPRVESIDVNLVVLAFASGILILTGIVAAVVPAVHAWRSASMPIDGRVASLSRQRAEIRGVLVVAQLSLTLPLLVGSVALVRSVATLLNIDPGFRTTNVLSLHVAIPRSKYRTDEQIATLYTRIVDRVGALPGVVAAAMINRLPLAPGNQVMAFELEGVSGEPVSLQSRSITPDYFRTMSVAIQQGRGFTDADRTDAPLVGIIDDRTAQTLWPGQPAVGKRFRVSLPGQQAASGQIVGVVARIRHAGLDSDSDRQMYLSHQQFTDGRSALVVRSAGDVSGITPAVLRAIRDIDPEQPVYDVRSMDDVLGRSAAQRSLSMTLVTVFALAALVIASIGLYGVVAHGVVERRREIGVRLALGAARSDVSRLVLRQGGRLATLGAIIGLTGAVALMRALERLLFGVAPLDPATFVAGVALLAGAALLASYFPARRAASLDPAVVLRAD
jgi:putative ABC transport system permease protein